MREHALEDTIDARIQNFTPDQAPSFATIVRRKRTRDWRRRSIGTLCLIAVGALTISLVPSGLLASLNNSNDATLAGPVASADAELTPEEQAFVRQCTAAAKNEVVADEFIGMSEATITSERRKTGATTRVIGRNGVCIPFDFDRQGNRLNLIVSGDRIIWAARF